jgi:predicted nuclease of predicted toxin-antitoxin system
MKIKLDENIGCRGAELLRAAGHDVMTVRDQNLQGASDELLFKVCADEARVLITLDHDFGQVLRFPPERGAGLVVLELGTRVTALSLLNRLQEFLTMAQGQSPSGALWIVEPGRVRVHLASD